MKIVLMLSLIGFSMSGCTFNVARVPPPDEFSKPIAAIVDDYPEMNKVFKSNNEHSEFGMAKLEPFLDVWGEPESKTLSWWNLWPGNWLFMPQEVWVWELGGKSIQCRIDRPIYEGFEKTICNCQEIDEG